MRSLMISLCLFMFVGCGINTSPGSGEKIGQIVRLQKVGMMCDTWEGQLIRGGISDGSGSFGTVPFEFTIENDIMVEQVREYMNNQTEVVIKYTSEGVWYACRSESNGAFLTSITPKDSL